MTTDCSSCASGSGCSSCSDHSDALAAANLPGQSELHWRTTPHGDSLARMRAWLAGDSQPLAIRSLAHQGTDDPAIALLDTWAVVADVVSFYTERIAQEGFLRTATERDSVRQQARTLGYELRPGVAAQAELAFDVETAAGSPEVVVVPEGTPVQTVPAPGQAAADLRDHGRARGAPGLELRAGRTTGRRSRFGYGVDTVWLDTTTAGVRVDDRVLVVGSERADVTPSEAHGDEHEKWDLRRVTAVDVEPAHSPGLDPPHPRPAAGLPPVPPPRGREGRAGAPARPAAQPLRLERSRPGPARQRQDHRRGPTSRLKPGSRTLEVDGDVPAILPGSWVVLEQPGHTEAYQVESVTPDGATKYALSGKLTRLTLDIAEHLDDFDRNQALVHAVSRELPAALDAAPGPRRQAGGRRRTPARARADGAGAAQGP